MANSLIGKVTACLHAEKEALLASDFDKLKPIQTEIGLFLDALKEEPLDERQATHLQSLAERNRLLLSAAMDGVRDAQSRLRTLRDVQRSLRTYGADGKRSDFSMENHRLEKKA